jgi:hypothetical protein
MMVRTRAVEVEPWPARSSHAWKPRRREGSALSFASVLL